MHLSNGSMFEYVAYDKIITFCVIALYKRAVYYDMGDKM